MSEQRPDPRQISGQLRAALEAYDKAQLADMLAHVFKDYVLEAAPPLRVSGSVDDEVDALASLTFVDLIAQLKARLDLPELDLFRIENGRVLVSTGDGLVPVVAGSAREAEPVAPPAPEAPPAPAPEASGRDEPAASASPGPPPMPKPSADPPDDKPAGDDDASIRFSLLELD